MKKYYDWLIFNDNARFLNIPAKKRIFRGRIIDTVAVLCLIIAIVSVFFVDLITIICIVGVAGIIYFFVNQIN